MGILRARKQTYSTISQRNPWLPGWRRIPVLGAGALGLSIIAIIFSAVVLAVSDGKTLEAWDHDWTFSPTVYLSIASTIVNITLSYAFTVGVNISWWRAALGPHTTISKLHRAWSHGNSFVNAARSLRHPDLIAIACIVVAVTPINGPLLQRASQVRTRDVPVTHSLDVSISHQLPRNYSGYIVGRGHDLLYNSNFSNIVREYSNQTPIQFVSSCKNDCKSTVIAAGWAVDCQSSYVPYDMTATPVIPLNESDNIYYHRMSQIFQSGITWAGELPSVIRTGAQMKTTDGCTGNLLLRNCTLAAATVQYPVRLTGSAISLEPGSTIWGDSVIGPVANASYIEPAYANEGPSTWGGLALALQNQYNSYMIASYDPIVNYQVDYAGAPAHAYLTKSNGYPDCTMIFSDPMDSILASARELMFRAAVSVGSMDHSSAQSITATETVPTNVYKAQYLFLGLATGLSVLGILFVIVTFDGFWYMGRKFSLNPIETAKAFNAPLLKSHDSNAPIKALLREIGARPVRYGAVDVDQRAVSEGTNLKHPTLPPVSAAYHDVPWGALESTSTERSQQTYQPMPLADDEFEMQEPHVRHADSGSQVSTARLMSKTSKSARESSPSLQKDGFDDRAGLHGPEQANLDDDRMDGQGPLMRLQLDSPESIQTPIVGSTYIG